MSTAQARKEMHEKGKKHFFANELAMAIQVFTEARTQHGPHVGLLADLSASYYLLGDMQQAQVIRKQIEHELDQARHLLSSRSHTQTLLFLSKMREEDGEINGAFECLYQALALETGVTVRNRIVAQIVRLASMFNMRKDLSKFYRELLSYRQILPHWDIECEHALMQAEHKLMGISQALLRLKKLMAFELNTHDLRLVLFDFAETALSRAEPIPNLVAEKIEEFSDAQLDSFESIIRNFVSDDSYAISLESLEELSRKLSFMGYLRITSLNQIRKNSNSATKAQLHLLIDSLDSASRSILLNKWGRLKVNHTLGNDIELLVQQNTREVIFKDQTVSFSRKQGSWIILILLTSSSTVTLEQISKELGCLSYDEDAYHRVRVAIQRLNRELRAIVGAGNYLKIRQHQLICEGLRFISAKS